jgi:hypothetical protein
VKENGCEWGLWSCYAAAFSGKLNTLIYLHENGCPWDYGVYNYAAKGGNFECLKYAHENGCYQTTICIDVDPTPEDLEYDVNKGYGWNCYTSILAAKSGNLDCLRYLHENGCKIKDYMSYGGNVCNGAAEGGNLECLKYLVNNGCMWSVYTCEIIAKFGNLEMLQYAHENGCYWDIDTCNMAMKYNNLDCLLYAYNNRCPGFERYQDYLRKNNMI